MREGWGMCSLNNSTLLTTDGTNKIFHINPSDFSVIKTVEVFNNSHLPLTDLNEIEIINGLVYANIFLSNKIAVIDPHTGELKDMLDFTHLITMLESEHNYEGYTQGLNQNNCLNGIAYNSLTK